VFEGGVWGFELRVEVKIGGLGMFHARTGHFRT
jgi:hypothetical protein